MSSISTQAKPGWAFQRLNLNRACWLLALVCLPALPSFAQQTNNAGRLDYSNFKIISDRNIFNTRRYARATSRRDSRPSARTESFALLGTMSYEKGLFAFFEGSSSDYKKVVKPSETIAGYTVTEIQPSYVKLNSGTNEVQLKVGMQLQREEHGEWQMSERIEPSPATPERPAVSTAQTPPATQAPAATPDVNAPPGPIPGEPPVIVVDGEAVPIPFGEGAPPPALNEQVRPPNDGSAPASPDEVLRRLMERRRQEENQ